jgi:hypothetical protein
LAHCMTACHRASRFPDVSGPEVRMCRRGRLRGTPHRVRVPLNGLQPSTVEQGTFLSREERGHFYRGLTSPERPIDTPFSAGAYSGSTIPPSDARR